MYALTGGGLLLPPFATPALHGVGLVFGDEPGPTDQELE